MKLLNLDLVHDFDAFKRVAETIPGNVEKRFAIAITRIAEYIKIEAQQEFPGNYIERNKWMRGGIAFWGAKVGRLTASVGTINYAMGLHLAGGKKRGNVAMEGIRGDDGKGKVPKATNVKRIYDKIHAKGGKSKAFFEMKINGATYLMKKVGTPAARQRKRADKGRGFVVPSDQIVPMWIVMKRQIQVKPDWELPRIADDKIFIKGPEIINDVLEDAWDHAVKAGKLEGNNPYRRID